MLVRHLMSRALVTVEETTPCRDALALLRDLGIRRAPVMRGRELVGIVSERDLLRVLPGSVAELSSDAGYAAARTAVSRVMAADVLTAHPDDPIEVVARAMVARKIGGVPVVIDGALVGIVTESDVFRAFVALTEPAGATRLTLSRREDDDAADARLEPLRTCVEHGLEVTLYHAHGRPGGARAHVVHVQGARIDAAIAALEASGFVLVSRETPAGSRAA